MNDLYTANYHDEGPFFLSNFGQITRCIRIHGVHNEEAIDRNTEAIKEQTAMQKAESDESQNMFSAHSMMVKAESDETQEIFALHTQAMREESEDIQKVITAQTKTIKDESDETQQILSTALNGKLDTISNKLQDVSDKIAANTTGDATNANNIVNAINRLPRV